MQVVSNAWKTTQLENILPLSDIEIKYAATDADAMNYATVSSNSSASVVTNNDLQSIVQAQAVRQPTQTAELNKWRLGGNIQFSDSIVKGWISGYISKDNQEFDTNPTVTITFSQLRTIRSEGVVVKFSSAYNEYASNFIVTAYNGSSQVATKTVTNNTSVEAEVSMTIQNYNKIVITITKWCLPQSRARIENVSIGSTKTFTKADIISYKQNMKSSLFSYKLPDYNIEFEFDNSEDEWNPDNPTGIYSSLAVRQEIQVKYGYLINGAYEYIPGGIYFLSEWNTPQNGITARFKAQDLTIFMQSKFDATNWNGATATLKALADEAFNQSNIPLLPNASVRWVTTDLAAPAVTLPNNLDQYTCAEIVQMCCCARACVMRYGRDGIMYCEKLDTTQQSYEINRFNSYKDAEYDMSQVLKAVSVNDGMFYDVVGASGEVQYVDNPLFTEDTDLSDVQDFFAYTEAHLGNRRTLSGQFRIDPRLDVFDYITVVNKYATMNVVITSLQMSYNGGFSAVYEGRVE